jgi:alkylation response protein AidB-like acyl-CoA dehydrogenase
LLLEGILNVGRATVASEMAGLSEEAFSRTVTYLKERKQFGKLIGEFQALQHRAAHLYTEIEITKAAVMKALQMLDPILTTPMLPLRLPRPRLDRPQPLPCRKRCRCMAASV